MHYTIISGSSRANSQSSKVALYIKAVLERKVFQGNVSQVAIVDLAHRDFPEWDNDFWKRGRNWTPKWKECSDLLLTTDALVVISPEWGGMVPPSLKNFFQLCTNGELLHKPGLIITVSAGDGGAYPVAELRTSGYKNTKICYIPEQVIIREVGSLLNNIDSANGEKDTQIRMRIDYALEVLQAYAFSFIDLRKQAIIAGNQYPYGM